jgi:hypothetical protein
MSQARVGGTDKARGRRERRGALSKALEGRLAAYALAAGAGIVCTAQPAHAGIIYTPADITFTGGTVFIPFNGVNDFRFTMRTADGEDAFLSMGGLGNPGAGVVGKGSLASALALGMQIGPKAPFVKIRSGAALMAEAYYISSFDYGYKGKWKNAADKFLGVRFDINGQAHFGWAEFDVSVDRLNFSATLLGYAYDTVANQGLRAGQTSAPGAPAATPEPATLGLLALGSVALGAWRTRRRVRLD